MTDHEPTDKSKWFRKMIVCLAIILCSYQFGFKPIYDNYKQKSQWDVIFESEAYEEDGKAKLLMPGFHLVSSFPFIVIIDTGYVGVMEKDGIRSVPITEIPFGYVGVITDKSTKYVNPTVLKPGTYYLNPNLYEVDKIFTGKQTWHYGGAKDE